MNTLTAISKTSFYHWLSDFFHNCYEKYIIFKITHFSEKTDFTYDLEAMKKAVNQPSSIVPKSALESDESFEKWLNE